VSNFRVVDNGTVTNYVATLVTGNIQFTGDAGNDVFVNLTSTASVASGGAGHDVLRGGSGNDTLNGDEGKDVLSGGRGNDILNGGADNDVLTGDFGDDTLNGDDGHDKLFGGFGADSLNGGNGNDILHGGIDNRVDVMTGGAGRDLFVGNFWWRWVPNAQRDTYVDFTSGEDRRIPWI
jgi:Ca2+-binding RTX toxin-like protein